MQQHEVDNMRLTKRNTRSELLVMPRVTNKQENGCQESSWVDRNIEGPAGFRYEISDLFSNHVKNFQCATPPVPCSWSWKRHVWWSDKPWNYISHSVLFYRCQTRLSLSVPHPLIWQGKTSCTQMMTKAGLRWCLSLKQIVLSTLSLSPKLSFYFVHF